MKNESLTFKKIWESTFESLSVGVINQLIQLFRENTKVLEPLLRVLLIMAKAIQKEAKNERLDDLGRDMSAQLLKMLQETDIIDSRPETL